jgi:hypothetical protein
MNDNHRPDASSGQNAIYQITIRGHLGHQWTSWFDGLTVTTEESGNTLLVGEVIDQAALHGLLKKVRDLGLPLLSVVPVSPESRGGDAADDVA